MLAVATPAEKKTARRSVAKLAQSVEDAEDAYNAALDTLYAGWYNVHETGTLTYPELAEASSTRRRPDGYSRGRIIQVVQARRRALAAPNEQETPDGPE